MVARVSEFFYKESKSKVLKYFLVGECGGGGMSGLGAEVSDFFL